MPSGGSDGPYTTKADDIWVSSALRGLNSTGKKSKEKKSFDPNVKPRLIYCLLPRLFHSRVYFVQIGGGVTRLILLWFFSVEKTNRTISNVKFCFLTDACVEF